MNVMWSCKDEWMWIGFHVDMNSYTASFWNLIGCWCSNYCNHVLYWHFLDLM